MWLRGFFAGASAAVLSLTAIAMPVLLAWVASSEGTVDWTVALGVGASGWLLANGVHLHAGAATISLTPWLLTAVPLGAAVVAARRVVAQLGDGRPGHLQASGGAGRDLADAAAGFVGGYAATLLMVVAATRDSTVRPSLPTALLAAVLLPLVAGLLAFGLELRADVATVAPEITPWWRGTVPSSVRRAVGPAVVGVLSLLGVGLVLVVAAVAGHAGRVGHLYAALDAGVVGSVVVSIGQLLLLPNAAVWAVSFMAGPGFGIADGSSITWSSSQPGLLPMVPVLGALPAPGPMATWAWAVVAVPVGVGALIGWRSVRAVARLSAWQVKAQTAGTAVVMTAAVMTLAAWLAGGSVGAARLTGVGAPPLLLGVAVLGELLPGAAVVVGLSHLRASRR